MAHDTDSIVYTVRVWSHHGQWRIAVRPVGEDRLHLFTLDPAVDRSPPLARPHEHERLRSRRPAPAG